MRIALDARTVYAPQRRGTGKNLVDLYRELARLRPHWQVLAYHRQADPEPDLLPPGFARPRWIEMRGDRMDAWGRWRLPLAAWRDSARILHCPANLCPPRSAVPLVVTVHDLIPLDRPTDQRRGPRHRFAQSMRAAARRAGAILCPSAYTARRLVAEFGADPRRITINPWAPDRSVRPVDHDRCAPVLARYGLSGPYVLHLGAADPRKNTRGLLQAWAMLEPGVRRWWRLLVVGLDSRTRLELAEVAERCRVQDSVCLSGFAAESDICALLSAADLLAYPSLAEGFGLPLLDAWACGTAVLAGGCTSIPEIAGDAAMLVDPTDPWAIAGCLTSLLNDPALRQTLVRRGRRRVGTFTWESTARRFAEALERAAGLSDTRVAA